MTKKEAMERITSDYMTICDWLVQNGSYVDNGGDKRSVFYKPVRLEVTAGQCSISASIALRTGKTLCTNKLDVLCALRAFVKGTVFADMDLRFESVNDKFVLTLCALIKCASDK